MVKKSCNSDLHRHVPQDEILYASGPRQVDSALGWKRANTRRDYWFGVAQKHWSDGGDFQAAGRPGERLKGCRRDGP